jgi:flagellar hook-basal body complex protein FliE
MINPISTQFLPQALARPPGIDGLRDITPAMPGLGGVDGASGAKRTDTFSDLVGSLVSEVDTKVKVAEGEVRRLMLGESDNIHQSMIAMQESGLAFSLLVEVRNKLVDSYQELMRMAV